MTEKFKIMVGVIGREIFCCTVLYKGETVFDIKLPLAPVNTHHTLDIIGSIAAAVAKQIKRHRHLTYEIRNGIIGEFGDTELPEHYLPNDQFIVFNQFLRDILFPA